MAEPLVSVGANRHVFVLDQPWPVGMVTGLEDSGGFILEAFVVFTGSPRAVVRAMLDTARERGYAHIRCRLPVDFPLTPKLRRLAERVGFAVYAVSTEYVDLVWRP